MAKSAQSASKVNLFPVRFSVVSFFWIIWYDRLTSLDEGGTLTAVVESGQKVAVAVNPRHFELFLFGIWAFGLFCLSFCGAWGP